MASGGAETRPVPPPPTAEDLTPGHGKGPAARAGTPWHLAAGGQGGDGNGKAASPRVWGHAYTALAAGQALSAVACALAPNKAGTFVLGAGGADALAASVAAYRDDSPSMELLMGLLASGQALGASISLALAEAMHHHLDDTATPTRLKVGLAAWGVASLAVAVAGRASLAPRFLGVAAATFGATAAVPAAHLLHSEEARGALMRTTKGALGGLRRLLTSFPRPGLAAPINAFLTPALLAAGCAFVAVPHGALRGLLGTSRVPAGAAVLARHLGAALATVGPVAAATLKRKSDRRLQHTGVAGALNSGLFCGAVGHLALLAPMLPSGEGGEWLPVAIGTAVAAMISSLAGMQEGADERSCD